MPSQAQTVDAYIAELPAERQAVVQRVREVINRAVPAGFAEQMNYGMIGWVVPHAVYPPGYHCNPKLPLPFMGLASQKASVNLYHMGLCADARMLDWFTAEHAKATPRRLDMGKSCIRYRKLDDIPLELIGRLASLMSARQWIALYESTIKR
jgi:hypothetical protein